MKRQDVGGFEDTEGGEDQLDSERAEVAIL
jgi:hypothetical protein